MFLKPCGTSRGDWLAAVKLPFTNRTGATLLYGQLAQIDILQLQSETTTTLPAGDGSSVFDNLSPITQANFEQGFPVVVCAETAGIADNASGMCWVCGPRVEMAFLDDDVSTTDLDRGDRISVLVSESAVAAQEFVTGGTGSRQIGIALEDAAASSATAARTVDANSHLRYAIFYGGIMPIGTDT